LNGRFGHFLMTRARTRSEAERPIPQKSSDYPSEASGVMRRQRSATGMIASDARVIFSYAPAARLRASTGISQAEIPI
jgi:hypothetical protein